MKFPFGKFGKKNKKVNNTPNESYDGNSYDTESQDTEESGSNGTKNYTFVQKIGRYFSPEPQKEKVLRQEDFNAAGDTYYASVAVGYKITQRFLVLFLAFFLVFSFVTNYREITFDNFFYLIKEFTNAADTENSNYETLSYDSDTRHVFGVYRGGMAVANPSRISLYTATGRKTLDVTSTFASPCIEASTKYVLIYDTAGDTFSIYNSLSRIFTKTFDYPVTDAHIDDDGGFAVITRGESTQSSKIHVFDKNFKPHAIIPMDKYAFDVKINKKLDKIISVYYSNGDGTGLTEISVRGYEDPTKELLTVGIRGEFPLSFGLLESERYALVTNRSITIFNDKFDELDKYEFPTATVTGFSLDAEGCAVSYIEDSKTTVIAFDKEGKMLYNDNVYRNVTDIGVFGGYIFLRTESGVIRINPKTSKEEELLSDQGKMLTYDENTVLVCGSSKAEYLVFKEEN